MQTPARLAFLIAASAAAWTLPASMTWADNRAAALPAPLDQPFPGEVRIAVDASDVARRIFHVRETVSGLGRDPVLLYPRWLPGVHAPSGPIDRLAGIRVSTGGKPVAWSRDTIDVRAFHLQLAAGAGPVDIEFDYLSPTSDKVGTVETTPDFLMLEWNEVVLYPAGHYARQIPVSASVTIPSAWTLASALEPVANEGALTSFARVPLETLVDSPVFAGRFARRTELDAATGVHLDLFADRADQLDAPTAAIDGYRALVAQAYKLFGSHHYRHYDFLYALTDGFPSIGLEHHESSENSSDGDSFVDWNTTPYDRDLLAHEFTHSWNGKFRRPADLWTPSFEVPMQNSLLWVYEGQTQYWGLVLTARAGLWSKAQALEVFAITAADYAGIAGRRWRPMQDTTSDEIINPRRPMSWESWQRFEDYYWEGALMWLDADTLIREHSHGKRSLDDFARAFFGVDNGSIAPLTYTFEDVVRALDAVEPYDWARFLRERLDAVDHPPPLDGLRRGGYRLVYSDTPGEYLKAKEHQRKQVILHYSIGMDLGDKDGTIGSVQWDGPAFQAGLTEGMQVLAVNGNAYSADVLKRAIVAAQHATDPIVLILKNADRFVVARIEYHGGLRYPHLERDPSGPARIDDIIAPRP